MQTQPRPLFRLFSSFQTNNIILTTNKCEKCPTSIWRQESNSQPSDYKSPPLTTRPGLPPRMTGPFLRTNNVKNLVSDAWIRTHDLLNHNHKNRPLTRSLLQWKTIEMSWRSSVEGDEGCIGPRCKLLCLEQTPKNYATFNPCLTFWTIPFVHLLLPIISTTMCPLVTCDPCICFYIENSVLLALIP